MNATFLPASDVDRVLWLNNFSTILPQYTSALGLNNTDILTTQRDANYFSFVVQLQSDARQYFQAMSQYKNGIRSNSIQNSGGPLPQLPSQGTPPTAVLSGVFNRIATLVLRIKRAPGYTPSIGQALGIIAPESTFNPNDAAPELSVRIDAGHPLLRWKKGEFDGVVIYVDRRDGNGFVQLAHTVKTSYLDVTVLPANTFSVTWDYKARYFIGDDEVGQFSMIISLNVIRTS